LRTTYLNYNTAVHKGWELYLGHSPQIVELLHTFTLHVNHMASWYIRK